MNLSPISKSLFIAGFLLIAGGLFWEFGSKFLPLGRMPGDITVEKENFKFYFPLGTSVVLSLVLSLVLYLFQKLGSK
ncbi:MAG: DUF2905 domain-containing protein [Bdellovibrionota bacterium]